mgnify:CR=1 FL=1
MPTWETHLEIAKRIAKRLKFKNEEYEEFFCVVEKKISLQKRLKENDDKKSILEKIADCFTVGIPRDIKNTLTETVNNYTMGS